MVIPVVTAATPDYFPGVEALAASFVNAGSGFELHCICYGDLHARCEEIGVIPVEPVDWAGVYPPSDKWPEPVPASYCRLNLPRQFDADRIVWIDSDCIIRRPLTPLAIMSFSEPVAALYRYDENYQLGFQTRGLPVAMHQVRCTFNGLLVFNAPEWNRLRITERCRDAMHMRGVTWRFIDQSVLSYVLGGNFHHLGDEWQWFANRKAEIPKSARILHWVGGLPWRDDLPNVDEWLKWHPDRAN